MTFLIALHGVAIASACTAHAIRYGESKSVIRVQFVALAVQLIWAAKSLWKFWMAS